MVYLQAKLAENDWHGVRDAAADLEVMEAKHPELKNPAPRCRLPELYCQDPDCKTHGGR
ncbi:MAG TPA: hypothetical protein VF516_03295 [Kofleriaceae bacterium]